jgi:histone-binding protein RBBP4
LNTLSGDSKKLKPSRQYTHHTNVVNDVQHHPHPGASNWIGTVSDDRTLQIIDTRQASTDRAAKVSSRHQHSDAINSLAFNPHSEFLVATASADRTVGIWDLRNLKTKVHTLLGHTNAVTSVAWHPTDVSILGSGGWDRRVLLWDLSRVGEEQAPDDADDGPPEVLFMHGGHTNHLAEFSWNPNEPWVVCSAAEDNMLQIWQPADAIVGGDDDADIPMSELESERAN